MLPISVFSAISFPRFRNFKLNSSFQYLFAIFAWLFFLFCFFVYVFSLSSSHFLFPKLINELEVKRTMRFDENLWRIDSLLLSSSSSVDSFAPHAESEVDIFVRSNNSSRRRVKSEEWAKKLSYWLSFAQFAFRLIKVKQQIIFHVKMAQDDEMACLAYENETEITKKLSLICWRKDDERIKKIRNSHRSVIMNNDQHRDERVHRCS